MQHVIGQARQPPQAARHVEVAQQRHDAGRAQRGHALRAGGEREDADAGRQQARDPKPDIAAADDQDAGSPEAGRQRAEGGLV